MKKIHNFDLVYDSQKMFRLLLEAMSNPTRRVNIKEFSEKMYGNHSDFLALAMTLLDNEVTFSTCENQEISDEIVSLTLSNREQIDFADFIFVADSSLLQEVIETAKAGTLKDPQRSATIIVKDDKSELVPLNLSGPGIKDKTHFLTSRLVEKAIEIRDNNYFEYPQGLDLIFVTNNSELFAITRTTKKEVL